MIQPAPSEYEQLIPIGAAGHLIAQGAYQGATLVLRHPMKPQDITGQLLMVKEGSTANIQGSQGCQFNSSDADFVTQMRVLIDRFSGVLVVQVEDNGPGIPENEREFVLQPFYRALGTNVDGSGLGLTIVQEIAQQHGATVLIDSAHPDRSPSGLLASVRFTPKTPRQE